MNENNSREPRKGILNYVVISSYTIHEMEYHVKAVFYKSELHILKL